MNVRELREHLANLDGEMTVIIDAPFCCSRGPSYSPHGSLSLPAGSVRFGIFHLSTTEQTGPGRTWLMIVGTDAWGLNMKEHG